MSIASPFFVLVESNSRCHLCGVALRLGDYGPDGWHIDHVIPRFFGGSDDISNLRAACASCNLRKGTRSAVSVRRELRLETRLDAANARLASLRRASRATRKDPGFALLGMAALGALGDRNDPVAGAFKGLTMGVAALAVRELLRGR